MASALVFALTLSTLSAHAYACLERNPKTAEVMFNVSAIKAQGFRMWRYFDEENEDGIELTDAQGSRTFQINCDDVR